MTCMRPDGDDGVVVITVAAAEDVLEFEDLAAVAAEARQHVIDAVGVGGVEAEEGETLSGQRLLRGAVGHDVDAEQLAGVERQVVFGPLAGAALEDDGGVRQRLAGVTGVGGQQAVDAPRRRRWRRCRSRS